MAKIVKSRPTSPGRRHYKKIIDPVLTKSEPEKTLLEILPKKSGRNNQGKITVRHHGGRSKRMYRKIDFKRSKEDIAGIVKTIEYDPNRSSYISLIQYPDGEKRYILTPNEIKLGWEVISSRTKAKIYPGNCCPLKLMPEGTVVHNIELKVNKGGQLARSAGASARILGFDEAEKYVVLKLASGEIRKVLGECKATIGSLSNKSRNLAVDGKAGRKRWKGIRPTVRGSAMNPVDHPHGGGEGRTGIGRKSPLTPWGKKALGKKTRKKQKHSNKYIIKRSKGKK